jgi:hypothetical protein
MMHEAMIYDSMIGFSLSIPQHKQLFLFSYTTINYICLTHHLHTKTTMTDGRQRRENPSVGLLLEALASSSSLIRTRRSEDFGVLGVPHPPIPHRAYTGDPFGYEEQQDVLQSSFIGFFPWIKRILWYAFMGMILLMSSLCLYGGTVRHRSDNNL